MCVLATQRTSMWYHYQPLKAFYLVFQLFAIPCIYMPYWLFTSIPHFLNPPTGKISRKNAVYRHIRISWLRQTTLIAQRQVFA
jgi:hypothetical protein